MCADITELGTLADRIWSYRLENEVYLQLRRGLPVTRLPADSFADRERHAALARDALGRLDVIDGDSLCEEERSTAGYLRWLLETWANSARFFWLGFSVTPYNSFHLGSYLQSVFVPFSFEKAEDTERYLSLVADYRDVVSEMATKLSTQRSMGILLARAALPGTLDSLQGHRERARRLLPVGLERLEVLNSATVVVFRARLQVLVEEEVLPAFDALFSQLDREYVAAAPAEVGSAQYVDGAEYYETLVRLNTASPHSVEEIHKIGQEQVGQLAERMAAARARLGFAGSETDFHARLSADRRFYASDPTQVEGTFLRHIDALEKVIGRAFAKVPRAAYGVSRLPEELEVGMTYGYYQPPTPADPVGRYLYNGSDLDSRSLLTAASVIFHELVPGHHFQLARQAENLALPDIRREEIDLDAFNEGWAEYAAGLGWELGLYEDPYDAYGRLVHERFTAQRLVVDTGLGVLGWTLEQARDYMRANTTESEVQIGTETLRYATDLPAQALAYRLGFLEFTALRDRAAAALGSKFDARELHERLLAPGALPFGVIHDRFDSWLGEGTTP